MSGRVAVFDFDQTLAVCEVSPWIGRAIMRDHAFGGQERVDMLRTMFDELQALGVALAICSFNSRDVITSALSAVGLSDYFRRDLTRDRDDLALHGWRKSGVIAALILPAAGLACTDDGTGLCFADDDPGVVSGVSTAFPRALVILAAPRGDGLRWEHCRAIVEWARGADASAGADRAPSGGVGGFPQLETPQPQPQPQPQPCQTFEPKRGSGPLAGWCGRCGRHQAEHSSDGSPV